MQKKKMKKKADWLTKAKKRKAKKKDRGIVDVLMLMRHFFKELPQWLDEMADPRNPSYTTYTQADLVLMGILKNMCAVKSMRSMEETFNEQQCIDTLRILSGDHGMMEMPHADTLNYYLERLSPKCLADVRRKMVKSLIRKKSFYRSKLVGRYWRVIIDGTGLFYFREKHCENCLVTTITREEDGKEVRVKRYYHKVLEAKLVLAPGITISLDTEFIENEKEAVSKNDCEITAAKRLLERLSRDYPRLPICLQGDALYAAEPIMKICRGHGWKYILTQKASRQKALAESYDWIVREGGAERVDRIGKEGGTGEYVNHVEETAGKKEEANMYHYWYETEEAGKKETHEFQWVTNIELTKLRKEVGQSIKNTSSRLLESFRRHTVTDEDVSYISRYTTVYLE